MRAVGLYYRSGDLLLLVVLTHTHTHTEQINQTYLYRPTAHDDPTKFNFEHTCSNATRVDAPTYLTAAVSWAERPSLACSVTCACWLNSLGLVSTVM